MITQDYVESVVDDARHHHPDWLDLRNMNLTELPGQVGNLLELRSLNIGGNKFTSIPSMILGIPTLRRLYVQGNEIVDIPTEIQYLTRLEALYAARNKVTYVSDGLSEIQSLRVLDLAHNALASVPESLGNLGLLEQLYLHGNRIVVLPDSLANLTNLRHLDLSRNRLLRLPEGLGLISSLQTLNLEDNDLRSLPASLAYLRNVEHVYLDGNPLDQDLAFLTGPEGLPGIRPSRKTARRMVDIPRRIRAYGAPTIPPAMPGPQFAVVDGRRIDLVEPHGSDDVQEIGDLLPQLSEALGDLVNAAHGSNHHAILADLGSRYRAVIPRAGGPISIDACFSWGIRLSRAYRKTRQLAEADGADTPVAIGEAVESVLALHGLIIASTERGRNLTALAARERATGRHGPQFRDAARRVATLVHEYSTLATPRARDELMFATAPNGAGEDHAAATAHASWTVFNFIRTIARVAVVSAPVVVAGAVAQEVVIHSAPGSAASEHLTSLVNLVWDFFLSERQAFTALALAGGVEFQWILYLVDWMRAISQRPASK